MTTRMMHPLHGWTHAYSDEEIKRLQELGWSVEQVAPLVVADKSGDEEAALKEALVESMRMDPPPGASVSLSPGSSTIESPKRKPGRPRKAK